MVRLKNENGFTLIEVMITMLVLTVGILAMTIMQVKATGGSSSAYSRSRANSIALSFLEELKRLPFDDTNLTGTAGANLDAGAAVPGGDPTPANAAHVYSAANFPFLTNMYTASGINIMDTTGKTYQVFWNVDKFPMPIGTSTYTPFCTIRLFVYWDTPLGKKHLSITTIKYNNIKV